MGKPQDPSGSAVPQTLVRPWRLPLGEDSLTLRYRREPPSRFASPLLPKGEANAKGEDGGCLTAVAPLHSAFGQYGFSKPSFSKTRRVIT
ncbi:MAG: hypothetical protein RM347_020535 [Nostoc sp. ChiQUE02]